MIVAAQMKECVDDECFYFPAPTDSEFLGHFLGHGKADDDVSEMGESSLFRIGREAEDIRRHVFSTMFAVEFSHATIIDIGQGNTLSIWRETIPEVMQQFA